MRDKLFTVVIVHYNQLGYYKEAINSVLKQTYSNIELIIADDATEGINKEEIENYINANKKDNITNFKVRINHKNLGTVKNINGAIEMSNGYYISLFAADDVLFDENVISNYVTVFEEISKEKMVVSTQCLMYDEKLEKQFDKYIDPVIAIKANDYSAKEQNNMLLSRSVYAVGAMAFKRECFDKYGRFDEKYKVVEDWSYMLAYTRKGGTVFYHNVNSLKHRKGGISEASNITSDNMLSQKFNEDIKQIYKEEILPNLPKLNRVKRTEIFKQYRLACRNRGIASIIKYPSLFIPIFSMVMSKISKKLLKRQ